MRRRTVSNVSAATVAEVDRYSPDTFRCRHECDECAGLSHHWVEVEHGLIEGLLFWGRERLLFWGCEHCSITISYTCEGMEGWSPEAMFRAHVRNKHMRTITAISADTVTL